MSRTPLKHGIFLAPYHPVEENPTTALQRDIEMCGYLERLGFDEIWVGEHHSSGFEMIASPELFIAAAAQATRRIRFGTGVISLPYHHPLMVANRLAQLDHQTMGRVTFGFGPGQLVSDAMMIGLDPNKSRDRMAEALDAIVRLMNGEAVTMKTEWFELNDARAHLLPYSDPPKFAVASAITPSGGRLAGQYGMSMLCIAASVVAGFDVLAKNWEVACQVAAENGHTMQRSELRLVAPMHIAETRAQARENVKFGLERWAKFYDVASNNPYVSDGRELVDVLIESKRAVIGTPEDAIAMIERMQGQQGEFGFFLQQHVDWADWEQTRRSHELYARFVMPHFAKANRNRRHSFDWIVADQDAQRAKRLEAVDLAFKKHEAQQAGKK